MKNDESSPRNLPSLYALAFISGVDTRRYLTAYLREGCY